MYGLFTIVILFAPQRDAIIDHPFGRGPDPAAAAGVLRADMSRLLRFGQGHRTSL
jgi:hypothetical protein